MFYGENDWEESDEPGVKVRVEEAQDFRP